MEISEQFFSCEKHFKYGIFYGTLISYNNILQITKINIVPQLKQCHIKDGAVLFRFFLFDYEKIFKIVFKIYI